MTDTPQHIREIQLKIWLSKTPQEKLMQMMEDNAALYQFWNNTKKVDLFKTSQETFPKQDKY